MDNPSEQKTIKKNECQHLWIADDANENGGYARILARCVKCNVREWFEEKDAESFPVWWQDLKNDPIYGPYIK